MYSNGPTYAGSSVYTITATVTSTNLDWPWTTIRNDVQRAFEEIGRALEPITKAINKVIEAFKKTAVYKKLQLLFLKQQWVRRDLPLYAAQQIQIIREAPIIDRPTFRRRVCALSSSYRVRV